MLGKLKLKSKRTLAAIGVIFALTGFLSAFEPLDIAATSGANKLRAQPASGEFVVVGMDDYLQGGEATWPWAQQDIADAIQLAFDSGAKQVVLSHEVPLAGAEIEPGLADTIAAYPNQLFIVEPADIHASQQSGRSVTGGSFVSSASPVHAQTFVRFWGGVDVDFFALESDGRILPSAGSVLAGRAGSLNKAYSIDYAIDARSIPYVSLGTLYTVEQSRALLAGKLAILGFEMPPNAKTIKFLGQGRYGLPTLIAMQAETLKRGVPVFLPWQVLWVLSFFICFAILQAKHVRVQCGVALVAIVGSFALMVLLNNFGVWFGVANSWVMIVAAAVAGISRNLREKTRLENAVHPISGLPSTDALRTLEASGRTLVHLKIRRSSELLDILDTSQQKLFAKKVADLVNPGDNIWHGDNGRFYWFANDISTDTAQQHFKSLALIFRNGFAIDELNVSLEVVFGIDERLEVEMPDRVHGATLAAKQAIINAVQWQAYRPADRSVATWTVTLLKELDIAIERGDIYAVLQPKLDLRTGRISGAEALARWRHPEKGMIRPDEFIDQADEGGRLLALTHKIFDNALATCAPIIARDPDFVLSVNIAPSLLESPTFPMSLIEIVKGYDVETRNIMLEVTESSQFANDEVCSNTMNQLRKLGFELSIDDYGTANSTLEYLRKIPASELKIDRKFVSNMLDNEADYHMVASTIQLGHRLRMLVVAEGVENDKTLHTLQSLNCDVIQGFVFSKPLEPADFILFIGNQTTQNKKLINY